MATGSKSARITPRDGLARLISAIRRMGPGPFKAAKKSRGAGALANAAFQEEAERARCASSISRRLVATILSRMVNNGCCFADPFNV